ncbi:MAG: hypothetical protein J5881_03515 [Clostridia bacterium]|nr:hypothetical protein [Clostridia bacterium]
MKEELHLFIIWENGREKQKEILDDINKTFKILRVYEVEWDKELFPSNLSRFYGTNLPKGSRKEVHVGTGKFILVVLKVANSVYETRMTSKGEKIVNVNMFDKKSQYRELTGGGDKVHGTNNEVETNHDLTLLLDKNIEDFLKENDTDWDGNIQEIKKDLFGCYKWNSVSDMFYALNNCINYAILRNYESLPEEIYQNDHNDIDIICESLEDAAYVLNANPVFEEEYRVHYQTKVENRIAYFDLRHLGDNYYYENMEKNLLNNRIFNEKGFYTLNNYNYFYSLLYHALIHKEIFKDDYKKKLAEMNIEDISLNTSIEEYASILKKWMISNEYIIVEPIDKTVMLNPINVQFFKPLVYREKVIEEDLTRVNEYKKENDFLKEQNGKLTDDINTLKAEIEGIKDSRTWKIMNPIRKIKKIIKK